MTKTFHIHINGQVQGVGFRPYVFRLAKRYAIKGWVGNASDGVHVVFNANIEEAKQFYGCLIEHAPALARIVTHEMREIPTQFFDNFQIVSLKEPAEVSLLLTPDFALCSECRRELYDRSNRRFEYPFITCTHCGPRFSIIHALPYDRQRTVMQPFVMCPSCQVEYDDIGDRRYYSQTNSCPTCGIQLWLADKSNNHIGDPLFTAITRLKNGDISAIKGIGGYLLICDATNVAAIQRLRQRKQRPSKPFALLYPNMDILEQDADLQSEEIELLQSPAAPILLLNVKPQIASGIHLDLIAPNLQQIGAMLPYAPVLDLIAKGISKPLVATSANISGSSIIYKNAKAIGFLLNIADFILMHNRAIVIPQDDSVLRISKHYKKSIIIRRSRGLAPSLNFQLSQYFSQNAASVLAMGADLKSAFSISQGRNLYVSQFLGDLDSFDAQQSFEHTLHHFLRLLNSKPQKIITDKHLEYFSTQMGERLAKEWSLPLIKVQHHQAHSLAVLAENNLLDSSEPVLTVVWDGTGYGDDGQVWGGEFFYYKDHQFQKRYHFAYFPFILGDKMAREPRISALCMMNTIQEISNDIIVKKFSSTEWYLYQKMANLQTALWTSSVGRIFDGVASLLGLADKVSYEGEAALRLETLARQWVKNNGLNLGESYAVDATDNGSIPTDNFFKGLLLDLQENKPKDYIAAKFHLSLVTIIKNMAHTTECRKIAFSGGVFQNELLIDLILHHFQSEFELYFHRQLSPNDECISFGQMMIIELNRQL